MVYYWFDPLSDTRWTEYLARHPAASIFHTPAWLDALRRTYGFVPTALTSSPPNQPLADGIVLCRVRSWLTGRRLVSIPFSDHCHPLADGPDRLSALLKHLGRIQGSERWKYVELRPVAELAPEPLRDTGFGTSATYFHHLLDLRPSLAELSGCMHKACVRRKIRRAERDGISCEEGRSETLLREFYRMQLQARRKFRLPPQPYEWFRNLAQSLGKQLTVRIAFFEGKPVAGIVTVSHGKTITYKYGCSDPAFNRHGGMQMLLWRTIQQAKEQSLERLDLGRSDSSRQGLIDFKDRWGARRSRLSYLRLPAFPPRPETDWRLRIGGRILARLPDLPLSMAASIFYRHFA